MPSPRRTFLRQLPLAAAAAATACRSTGNHTPAPLRFGLISDVHQDIMHDGIERITAFIEAMTATRADLILQLGDFCQPIEANRPFLDTWNRFPGPRFHVLGNHDMDGGVTSDHAAAFFGMPARHHAFSRNGVTFIILDGNEPGGPARGYKRFIGTRQLAWLEGELQATAQPVVVFVHQALDHPEGIENQAEVRRVLNGARFPDGTPRVLAVFSGHHHMDWIQNLDGIPYIQINSASYHWVGEPYGHFSYPESVHQARPWIRFTCPYRDPLWTLATLDLPRRRLTVEGCASEWVGPTPWDLGVPEAKLPRDRTRPAISGRQLGLRIPPPRHT